jgi:hypothetical protein
MSQELILYTQGAPELPEAKKKGWELIGKGKLIMDQELQRHDIVIMQHFAGYDQMDQPALELAIKAYKSTWDLIVETRKKFTMFLDNVKDQCMIIEKKYDPKNNETFKKAVARELELRQDAFNEQQAVQNKSNEETAFRTFVINQFHDMVSDYRSKLATIVQKAYETCLTQRTPIDQVPVAINAALAAMRETRPKDMQKFTRFSHHTKEEAQAIFATIQQPDYQAVFNEVLKAAQEKFELYPNDLANAESALANQQVMFQNQQAQAAQQLQAEQAANTLAAQAAALTLAPAGVKGVTETTEIKLQDFDWVWAARIIAAFMAHYQACVAKVRVKKCHSLTVAQMAAALDAAGVKVEGVEYQILKK